jgi:hypothetical protein
MVTVDLRRQLVRGSTWVRSVEDDWGRSGSSVWTALVANYFHDPIEQYERRHALSPGRRAAVKLSEWTGSRCLGQLYYSTENRRDWLSDNIPNS